MGIFKAYDIRGLYPNEINEDLARKIGQAFVSYFKTTDIVVGRDMRLAGPSIFAALTDAICATGVNVIDIGMVSTPMVSYTVGKYGYQAGIMITASHNPKDYIGFKVCRENVVPVGYDNGLNEIERMVKEGVTLPLAAKRGQMISKPVYEEYADHVRADIDCKALRPLRIAIDAGNGMGGKISEYVFAGLPFEIVPLFFEPDGSFPNHEANPLKAENMRELQIKVLECKADIGVAYDGDADRVMFVDEQGRIVASDLITVLIGQVMLKKHPGATILYDLRSSRVVPEILEAQGAKTHMCRVGHAFIKRRLREEDGVFAGELSGHFYFKQHFYADDSMMASLYVLEALSGAGLPFSSIIKPFRRYYNSGEINSEVQDADIKIEELKSEFMDATQGNLDGLTVSYDRWWFNVRKSNTEPILRLNLEAQDENLGREKLEQVMTIIRR